MRWFVHAAPVRSSALVMFSLGLTACITPHVVEHYDSECQIVTRHMTLEGSETALKMEHCRNTADCTGQLVALGVVSAATAVVSGSIVIVGNVVFWMEKQGKCVRKKPDNSVSSSSAASTA